MFYNDINRHAYSATGANRSNPVAHMSATPNNHLGLPTAIFLAAARFNGIHDMLPEITGLLSRLGIQEHQESHPV